MRNGCEPLAKRRGGCKIQKNDMATQKRQLKDPLTNAQRAAEQFGARIGILTHLARLAPEIEERIFASLPFLSLKDIKRVHDALEARVTSQASRKAHARFEDDLQKIAREYQEKEEKAILSFCNDLLAPELEEEYA